MHDIVPSGLPPQEGDEFSSTQEKDLMDSLMRMAPEELSKEFSGLNVTNGYFLTALPRIATKTESGLIIPDQRIKENDSNVTAIANMAGLRIVKLPTPRESGSQVDSILNAISNGNLELGDLVYMRAGIQPVYILGYGNYRVICYETNFIAMYRKFDAEEVGSITVAKESKGNQIHRPSSN